MRAMKFQSLLLLFIALYGQEVVLATISVGNRFGVNSKVLQIRGGAGPLDPMMTGKVFTAAAIAQGLMANLGPKLTNEMYGLSEKDNDICTQFASAQAGTGILSHSVMLYCLLYKNMPLKDAQIISYVLWIYRTLGNILSGSGEEAGNRKAGQYQSIALFILAIFGLNKNPELTIKIFAVIWSLTGLQLILTPKQSLKIWQWDPSRMTPASKLMLDLLGYFLIASSVMSASMVVLDAKPLQAMGYSSIMYGMFHLSGLVSGDFEKLGINTTSHIFWFLAHVAIVVTTLI